MPNQIYSHSSRHRIAVVGKVSNGILGQGISDATVKIIAAPPQFVEQVILKAKLSGLLSVQIPPSSLLHGTLYRLHHKSDAQTSLEPSFPSAVLSPKLQEFSTTLGRSDLKSADKLQCLHHLLEDLSLPAQSKFQALQMVLDRLQASSPKAMITLERTRTAADGWFYFTGLPAGYYQLEASLPQMGQSYGIAQAQINVVNNVANQTVNQMEDVSPQGKAEAHTTPFEKMFVELQLMPTTLLGKVVNADDQEAIAFARVQIAGTENYVLSSKEVFKQQGQAWNYRILGLNASSASQSLVISAQNYEITRKIVQLQAGETTTLNVQLVPKPEN